MYNYSLPKLLKEALSKENLLKMRCSYCCIFIFFASGISLIPSESGCGVDVKIMEVDGGILMVK